MILVDTSALIGFLKGAKKEATEKLRYILSHQIPFGITSLIYQEILQGAKTEREYKLLKRYLERQCFFHPKDPIDTFAGAARIYFDCRRKGITIRSTIDCLIAQIAKEHDLFLLHDDSDFQAIGEVVSLKFY